MLPTGWREAALAEVATLSSGGTPKAKNPAYYDGDIPWAIIGDLNDGVVRSTAQSITQRGLDNSSAKVVPVNTILLGMYGSIGKLGLAGIRLATNQAIATIRAGDQVDHRYLFYYLLGQRRDLDHQGKGAAQRNISQTVLKPWPIRFPEDLDEQRRIVTLLEDHLSHLDAADAYLDAAPRRAAALNDQILDSELADKEGESVSLGDLLTVGLANGKSVPTEDGGFPVLRLTALRDGRIDLAERKAGAWSASDAARFLVQRGDFFIARGNGSLRLVGRGGLVTDDPDPVAYPDTLIRARPSPATISPEFLALVWNAPAIRRQIERMAKTTAGIYKINQKDVAAVQVPVPALIDQERIVRAVSVARESLAKLAGETGRSRMRGAALRRSLLAAAFSGQLTTEMATA